MPGMSLSVLGVAIEAVSLAVGWIIYKGGVGVGAGGITPMLAGIALGALGLFVGEILGFTSLIKREGKPLVAAVAILIPLGVLIIIKSRVLGPL
jgi:hypothetical protein